jgi:hypothetical protein
MQELSIRRVVLDLPAPAGYTYEYLARPIRGGDLHCRYARAHPRPAAFARGRADAI